MGELSGFKPELDEGGAITQDSAFNFRHDFLSHPLLEMPKPRKSFSALAIGSWSSPTPVFKRVNHGLVCRERGADKRGVTFEALGDAPYSVRLDRRSRIEVIFFSQN